MKSFLFHRLVRGLLAKDSIANTLCNYKTSADQMLMVALLQHLLSFLRIAQRWIRLLRPLDFPTRLYTICIVTEHPHRRKCLNEILPGVDLQILFLVYFVSEFVCRDFIGRCRWLVFVIAHSFKNLT